jgi:hypothetical protein
MDDLMRDISIPGVGAAGSAHVKNQSVSRVVGWVQSL